MNIRTVISVIAAIGLALSAAQVVAQHGPGAGGGGQAQPTDRDMARDRVVERDFDRDRDRIHKDEAAAQDRVRDRIHLTDPLSMRADEIYGSKLMTKKERKQYRKELAKLQTIQERERYQIAHEKKMQDRARIEGKDLVPPGHGPVYGGELMTVQERNEYREALRVAGSNAERQKLMAEHREAMQLRAKARGKALGEPEEAE